MTSGSSPTPVILVCFREKPFSADEFRQLAVSAGTLNLGELWCSAKHPTASCYISQGKIEELQAMLDRQCPEAIIIDAEITPIQERNLSRALKLPVIDRTRLILDIFARRARSHEGKLQVEIAQLKYLRTRLVRGWTHLERQRGGIGLRGPGESQLETDRRLITGRLKTLNKRLKKVRAHRELGRRARNSSDLPLVSLIGRTNAGKSTLFNILSSAKVLVADRMFATLDPTLRRIEVPGGNIILSDTVGFIHHLPETLVEAFQATLEEINNADLLLEVIDVTSPCWQQDNEDLEKILCNIGAENLPRLRVFNKTDLSTPADYHSSGQGLDISALTGAGLAQLRQQISSRLFGKQQKCLLQLPLKQSRLRAELYLRTRVLSEAPITDQLLEMSVQITARDLQWLQQAQRSGNLLSLKML